MKFTATQAAVVLSQVAAIAAHGGVTSWTVGSTTYPGWQPYLTRKSPPIPQSPRVVVADLCIAAAGQDTAGRPYSSYNPILDAVDPTMHCNNDGNNGPIPESITVAAGSPITAHW